MRSSSIICYDKLSGLKNRYQVEQVSLAAQIYEPWTARCLNSSTLVLLVASPEDDDVTDAIVPQPRCQLTIVCMSPTL